MQFDLDMKSVHSELFVAARELLLKDAKVTETKKEKITTYTYGGAGLCHIRTMPNGVDIGFLKGAMMNDKFKNLHGETKRMRVLSIDSFDPKLLDYYFEEAKKLNEKWPKIIFLS